MSGFEDGDVLRRLLTVLVILPLGLGAIGCGATHSSIRSTSTVASSGDPRGTTPSGTPPTHRYLNDGDNDPNSDEDFDDRVAGKADEDKDSWEDNIKPENNRYHDKDDIRVMAFGHAANVAEERTIGAIVKRYYAAAVAGDGVRACSMIYSPFAKSVAEDYGRGSAGPRYLRGGTTCQSVMSLLFKHSQSELDASLAVTDVRVEANHALALLGSRSVPASFITLQREHGAWKVAELLGNILP